MSRGTYRYRSEFAEQLREEGRQEGRQARGVVRSILLVLEHRGVAVSDAARARIEECAKVTQLDTWLVRAMTVTTVDELFD